MAQQDQWQQAMAEPGSGAIDRLEAALGRIAAAAGRRQDELRVAELTARAAQHEADLLLRAQQDRIESPAELDALAARHRDEMRDLARRLDDLIATVRTAIPDVEGEPAVAVGQAADRSLPDED